MDSVCADFCSFLVHYKHVRREGIDVATVMVAAMSSKLRVFLKVQVVQ